MIKFQAKLDKADQTTRVAREMMDNETNAREKKTARLRELRLAKEAEDAAAAALEEPKAAKPARKKAAAKAK